MTGVSHDSGAFKPEIGVAERRSAQVHAGKASAGMA
jgi:hypothetical protein